MSLTKEKAQEIVATLKAEFNGKAYFVAKSTLNGEKVFVYHPRKADDATLRAMEARANVVAGQTLTRTCLEFKTGQVNG